MTLQSQSPTTSKWLAMQAQNRAGPRYLRESQWVPRDDTPCPKDDRPRWVTEAGIVFEDVKKPARGGPSDAMPAA